jgi:hypothetical protein
VQPGEREAEALAEGGERDGDDHLGGVGGAAAAQEGAVVVADPVQAAAQPESAGEGEEEERGEGAAGEHARAQSNARRARVRAGAAWRRASDGGREPRAGPGVCAYNRRVPVGNWLVLLVALAMVALDVSVAAPWTGLPVFLGMLLVVLAVAERMRQLVFTTRGGGQPAGWLSGGCCGSRGRCWRRWSASRSRAG